MKEYTIGEYRDKMLRIAQDTLPKESKQLLKTEAQKLRRYLVSYSNRNVPVSEIDEGADHRKYHKSFKTGKTYVFNEALSKRVFNNSGHGKYVESGRPVIYGHRRNEKWGAKAYSSNYGQGRARYYKPHFDPNKERVYAVDRRSKHYNVYYNVKKSFQPIYAEDLINWIDKMIGEGKL